MRTVFRVGLTTLWLMVAATILFTGSCRRRDQDDNAEDPPCPVIAVSIPPQEEFVRRIAGGRFSVIVLIPPGASPATYEPSPSDMSKLENAAIWFTVGVPFEEAWVPRFLGTHAGLDTVNTVAGIDRRPMGRDGHSGEQGGDEHGEHIHADGSPDPHVWLSPELVRLQAVTITDALVELDPGSADIYRYNLEVFSEDIDSLQVAIHELLDPVSGSSFMVFHPSWGYFADEFGLVQVPVEVDGNEPSPEQLARLIDSAVGQNIGVVFVSPQFSSSSAEVIASEIGGITVQIDPLGADWEDGLMNAAARIAEALDSR